MKQFLIVLTAICCFSCETATNQNQISEVEGVVKKMNASLAQHHTEDLLGCYSAEMDWENSFGWTIRDKETLNTYFCDWLFPKYPKLENNRLQLKFEIDIINPKTAWVDVLQEIFSEDLGEVVRTYRQSHLLSKESGNWLIKKTRFWLPHPNENPPVEFLSSAGFFE